MDQGHRRSSSWRYRRLTQQSHSKSGEREGHSNTRGIKNIKWTRPEQNSIYHTTIRTLNIQHRETIQKAPREKQQVTNTSKPSILNRISQQNLWKPGGHGAMYFNIWKTRTTNLDWCVLKSTFLSWRKKKLL